MSAAHVAVTLMTAAAGFVLYFAGAILTHLRARNYSIGPAAALLTLAAAALVLGLASDGTTATSRSPRAKAP